MIALFSENYNLTIDELSDTKTPHAKARIVRQATLDGGVVMEHNGVAHGDRTFRIIASLTALQATTLRLMFENETVVYCVTGEGIFSGAIASLEDNRGDVNVEYYVKEKIE